MNTAPLALKGYRRSVASLPIEILILITNPGFLIRARGLALAKQTDP